jgi:hypothetical protein
MMILMQSISQFFFTPAFAEFNQDDNQGFYEVTVANDDVGIDLYNSIYTDQNTSLIRLLPPSIN